jgi:hypothetical protein
MIARKELRNLVRARLRDAEILYANRRYAGAVYVCGYAVELVLKDRICRTLKWAGFPETSQEMQSYRSFIVHNLEVLLHLSGVEAHIKTRYMTAWSIVVQWDPELRYQPSRQTTRMDAFNMLSAARTLARIL